MRQSFQSTRTGQPLYLFYQIGLISLGLGALALATASRGATIVISSLLGGVLIASAFLGVPGAVISYARARQGHRPGSEAFFAIAGPLVLFLITAWVAYSNAARAYYLSGFVTPHWTDVARPVVLALVALLNLGVLVANALSRIRGRR